MVQALTDANFEAETQDGLVLVDFWATWCGPCRMQSPVIEQLDDEMGDQVKFTKVDVDENQETARQFGIMSIPTLLIKKDGEAVETLIGYTPKEKLEQILEQYL
ncbi:thioredoxin [Aerococcus sanguinicola]|uniref:Thioredoxin n=1 Tax=Aerococcus sanguinicola TaxID=119206 RepID=A0A0X8FC68_9LACT|nr:MULTISPECIES: thioredoxin [Aerococcus]AMB94655.1 thioredoxin [Aerococcus sanguinicola]MDK6805252.1 thioredoxin [Aerococcus sp. UMB7834]MDK7050865.1 thioredoxin [Aerococcus sanguinicola]MDK8501823.1 thioredoxin [Aerococcus sp. UMB1112A]OFT96622.1 thiol reductase thioredoxin [Aerococcus sp. HMSC23C02]